MSATENIYIRSDEDVDLTVRLLTPLSSTDPVTFTAKLSGTTIISKETPTGITLFPSVLLSPDKQWPTTCELVYDHISIHLATADLASSALTYTIVAAGEPVLSGTLYIGTVSCQIKYSDWPNASLSGNDGWGPQATQIQNEGLAALCEGLAAVCEFIPMPSGATSFLHPSSDDYIKINQNPTVNNLQAHTMEFFGYLADSGERVARLWDKESEEVQAYYIYFNITAGNNFVVLRRGGTPSNTYAEWQTSVGSLTSPGFNHIQISWDASNVANSPVIKINNVPYTVGNGGLTSTGSDTWDSPVSAWADDSACDAIVSSNNSLIFGWPGGLLVYRLYDAALTDPQLIANYTADLRRLTVPTPSLVLYPTIDQGNFVPRNFYSFTSDTFTNTGNEALLLLGSGSATITVDGGNSDDVMTYTGELSLTAPAIILIGTVGVGVVGATRLTYNCDGLVYVALVSIQDLAVPPLTEGISLTGVLHEGVVINESFGSIRSV